MTKSFDELAPCGVDCTHCEILRVTVHGGELKPATVRSWKEIARQHWGIPDLDPGSIRCRGCRDESFERFPGSPPCPIKICVKRHGLTSCGLCPEFEDCQWLDEGSRGNLKKAVAMTGEQQH